MHSSSKKKSLGAIICVASLGGFLFGFDMAVVSGVLPLVKKQFDLTAVQEGYFVSSALVGCILGVAFSGELSDRAGRRKPLLLAAVLFFFSALGSALCPSLSGVVASRILGGTGIGLASNVVPLYISEIASANVRGRLVTYYQLALTLGILAAYLSNAAVLKYSVFTEAWRAMFGLGVIPAICFLAGLFMVPESPRWLLRKGRSEEAASIAGSLGIDGSVAVPAPLSGSRDDSYRQLFAPGVRKALLIGILLPLFSQFSGINAIIYYGPSILGAAGFSLGNSLLSQIVFGAANMLFTIVAIWKVDSWGRRPLYLAGSLGAALTLLLTGLSFYTNNTSGFGLLACVLAFLACFAFSIGPLKFVVASEIFPNAIRGRALAISVMTMWVADTIVGQLTPVFLKWLGTAGTFWIFSFFCMVAFVCVYYLLPETKGKSLEQIELQLKDEAPESMPAFSRQVPFH